MDYLFLIGRILFGGFFLYNAYRHLVHGKSMAGYAQSKGVPAPNLAIFVSGLLLLFGGLCVITGWRQGLGLWALVLFLVPTTYMMHSYWKHEDASQKAVDRIQFMKNIALLGAVFMMFLIPTPWPFSL